MRYVLLLGAIVAAIGGYWVYWSHLATRIAAEIDALATDQRRAGLIVEYGRIEIGGFPFRLAAAAEGVVLADPRADTGWRWRADKVTAVAQPWRIGHVIVDFIGAQSLSWLDQGQSRHATMRAVLARASLAFDRAGRVERASLEIDNLVVEGDTGPMTVGRAEAHGRPSLGESGGGARAAMPGFDIALDARNLRLPQAAHGPLGRDIAALALAGRVAPDWPPGPWPESLRRWRDDGGVLDLATFRLDWNGVELVARGTLALDKETRPLAALTARITGHGRILEALAAAGQLQPRDARNIATVLALLAKTGQDGKVYLDVPITAQDGRLFVGPVAVLRLPPLVAAPRPPADGQNSPR